MQLMKATPTGPEPMTADEGRQFLAAQAEAAASAAAATLRAAALAALQASDAVAIRCAKSGVPFPADWLAYDDALRAVVRTGAGDLPPQPAYPAAT